MGTTEHIPNCERPTSRTRQIPAHNTQRVLALLDNLAETRLILLAMRGGGEGLPKFRRTTDNDNARCRFLPHVLQHLYSNRSWLARIAWSGTCEENVINYISKIHGIGRTVAVEVTSCGWTPGILWVKSAEEDYVNHKTDID